MGVNNTKEYIVLYTKATNADVAITVYYQKKEDEEESLKFFR